MDRRGQREPVGPAYDGCHQSFGGSAVRGYLTGAVAAAVSFGGDLAFQAAFGEYGGSSNCGDFLCGPFVNQRTSLAILANSTLVIAVLKIGSRGSCGSRDPILERGRFGW